MVPNIDSNKSKIAIEQIKFNECGTVCLCMCVCAHDVFIYSMELNGIKIKQ